MKAPTIMPQGGKNRMPTSMPAVAPREAYFVPPVTRVSQHDDQQTPGDVVQCAGRAPEKEQKHASQTARRAGQHWKNTAEKAYDAEYHGCYVDENFHIVRQSELSVRKCNIFGNLSKTYGRH